jgi:hypothetical protein
MGCRFKFDRIVNSVFYDEFNLLTLFYLVGQY